MFLEGFENTTTKYDFQLWEHDSMVLQEDAIYTYTASAS